MTEWITVHRFNRVFSGLLLLVWSATSIATLPAEQTDSVTGLQFIDPWVRQMPPTTAMRAGYVEIHNPGDTPIEIWTVHSDDFELAEIHQTIEVDGRFRMQRTQPLHIAAGDRVVLQPGGLHVMLMRPVGAAPEDSITISFTDGEGHTVDVVFAVRP